MSDATLPPLRSASTEADLRPTQSSDSISIDSDIFPFLVHSQHSITNGEPPEVDNGKLARQKRRRTSPEDQAILEAEYKRNPKPDKAARVEILKKVSLGEKEVQIWFQNRRQNTRRKSRPLLPHEIAAFGLSDMVPLSSSLTTGITPIGSSEGTNPSVLTFKSEISSGSDNQRQPFKDGSQKLQDVPSPSITIEVWQQTLKNPEPAQFTLTPVNSQPDSELTQTSQHKIASDLPHLLPSPQPSSPALGYLPSHKNAPATSLGTPMSSETGRTTMASDSKHSPPSSCPERISTADRPSQSSAAVRLSLSLDGKAELVASQVSPPRPQHPRPLSATSTTGHSRPGGLRRSQSDLPIGLLQRKASSHVPVTSGRSRNARTWEFCCDTEARDELTTQAENESSGSALAAISLLRSTSNSNLKANTSKRNAPPPKTESGAQGKKPKLGRASSSLARLQARDKKLMGSPSGDSDKENWLPQDPSGNAQRRVLTVPRPQKQNRRRVLEESKSAMARGSALRGPKPTQQNASLLEGGIFQNGNEGGVVVIDRDVDRFMRGEVSPSKKGDLDCIQGLLSLSQGTWR